jgi:hypothetical protein
MEMEDEELDFGWFDAILDAQLSFPIYVALLLFLSVFTCSFSWNCF